jgi:hypothetical protein
MNCRHGIEYHLATTLALVVLVDCGGVTRQMVNTPPRRWAVRTAVALRSVWRKPTKSLRETR